MDARWIVAILGVALTMHVAARRAALANENQDNTAPESVDAEEPAPFYWGAFDLWGMTEEAIEERQVTNALQDTGSEGANLEAFLSTIAASEGTDKAQDPYRVCYGYRHTIEDMSDHPAITGEWRGESIASLGPQYAGKVSTAAGRYQIIKPTWLECQRELGLGDFGPASQDAAAVYLIKRRGALDLIKAGRVEAAIALCRKEWASLPGAGYGQPERKMATLIAAYQNAGGVVA